MKRLFASFLVIVSFCSTPALAQSNIDNPAERLILHPTNVYAASSNHKPQGIVYFVRGILGVFSLGLDQMGGELRSHGANATVINHNAWKKAAVAIFNHHKRNRKDPIILVGHSWGANAILRIAKFLQERQIKVRYFVTFEPNVNLPVPANVEVAVNYYLSNSLLGIRLKQERGATGSLQNIDLISLEGIGHFNIEKQNRVQHQVVTDILRNMQ